MAGSGINQAVTKDGDTYNKLQRPKDYLTTSTVPPRPCKGPLSDNTLAGKRKREQADASSQHKRTRVEQCAGHKELERGSDKSNKRSRVREGGLVAALPGLDDDEEHVSDDSRDNALAYLRSVRTEASSIPTLLVARTGAPSFTHRDEGMDTEGVLFTDGVCLAVEGIGSASYTHKNGRDISDASIENAFSQQLLKRFYYIRTILGSIVPEDVAHLARTSLKAMKDNMGPGNKSTWPDSIDYEDPCPGKIVHMSATMLFSGLEHCTCTLGYSNTISPRTSHWIWALLAAVGDAGTLDNRKMSKIRDLGVKAGLLGAKLRNDNIQASCGSNSQSAEEHHSDSPVVHCECEESVCIGTLQPETRAMASNAIVSSPYEKSGGVETDEHADRHSAQFFQNHGMCTKPALKHIDESAAEMPMSNDSNQAQQCAKENDFEEARARLLAQLGDRLVQAQFPAPERQAKTQHVGLTLSHSQSRPARDSTPLLNALNSADRSSNGGGRTDWSDLNTRVTIDMVVTVVAECFGQRDLLTYRGW